MSNIINNSLAQHVSKIEEVPGHIVLMHLFFKDRVSVSIIDLYACVSSGNQFEQASNVNFFIAQVVNSSSFVVLGSNFNEYSSKKSANYEFCLNLRLVNSFGGHSLAGTSTWSNSKSVEKVIDHILVSESLILAVASHRIGSVFEFFDTDHKAVSVSANKNHWKFKLKGMDVNGWKCFMKCSAGKFLKKSVDFHVAEHISNLDKMWNILKRVVFSEFEGVRNKLSSKFHRLELLMSKIASSLNLDLVSKTDYLIDTWSSINSIEASKICVMINIDNKIEDILHHILVIKRGYHKSKYHEFKVVRDDSIKKAISRHMENFCTNKEKCLVAGDLSDWWNIQYAPLSHVDDNTFSGIMSDVSMEKLLQIHSNSLVFNEGTLTNTRPIALIETAQKILFKILSDKISLACSRFDVLHGDNFLVLKDTYTQFSIFAVGSIDMHKTYDSVNWSHLLNSLVRIKMCLCFINFFSNIHNGRFNQVMTDFGLSDSYIHIFYDSLLCEVKKHEQLYDYQMCSKFYAKSVGNYLAATQNILNIVSKFFSINDISINSEKTVAILINQGIKEAKLFISGSSISVAKKSEFHHYLGIFLSTEDLSKPSLAKVHNDVKFFSNVVLRKAIIEKQFLYLVSAVLQSIIYKLLKKGLKFKANLPRDFPSVALYHSELYGLKSFKQVLSKSLLANLINFSNTSGTLSKFFNHRVMDLQTVSWMSWHSLCFLVTLPINPLNCFLASTTWILISCKTSLESAFSNVFWAGTGVPILNVLGLDGYLGVRKFLMKYGLIFANQLLDHYGICLIPTWFVSVTNFVNNGGLDVIVNVVSHSVSTNFFHNVGFTSEYLLVLKHESIEVYTDGSINSLGSIGVYGGTAAYFPRANISIGVKVLGSLSSTLVELQAITLALDCVPISSTVELFTDSQALLDICKFDIDMSIKGHSDIIENEQVDFLANITVFSKSMLSLDVPYHFLRVKDRPVSENACYFIKNLFNAVNFVNIIETGDAGKIDAHKSFSVWHPNGRIQSGYTSLFSASLQSYLMKSLHRCLLVTVRKRLYDPRYLSVMCIRCSMVEDSDHLFLCSHDNNAKRIILFSIRERWYKVAGDSAIGDRVVYSLYKAELFYSLYMLLAKGFVLKSWTADAIRCLGLASGGHVIINLVYSLVECHRLDIWLPAAKLRAFYEKHNLLLCNRFIVPLVIAVDVICGLGIRLGIYMSFGLCPHIAGLGFGFLCNISLIDPVSA
ncbi:hypothetical protein G9A89_010806 [Geosiphon pyriformis]|nr:hypothetical protein G9A89_010806 [Geosiphon pyriformis]